MAISYGAESLHRAIEFASSEDPLNIFFPTSATSANSKLYIRNFTRFIPLHDHKNGVRASPIDFSYATASQGDYIMAAIFQGARNKDISRLSAAQGVHTPEIPMDFEGNLRLQFVEALERSTRLARTPGWSDQKLELYLNISDVLSRASVDREYDQYGLLVYCLSEQATFGLGFNLISRFFPAVANFLNTNIANISLTDNEIRGCSLYKSRFSDMRNLKVIDLLTYLSLDPAGHLDGKRKTLDEVFGEIAKLVHRINPQLEGNSEFAIELGFLLGAIGNREQLEQVEFRANQRQQHELAGQTNRTSITTKLAHMNIHPAIGRERMTDRLPNDPEQYGLAIDRRLTQALRESYAGQENQFVVSIKQLRENPGGYMKLINGIIHHVVDRLHLSIDNYYVPQELRIKGREADLAEYNRRAAVLRKINPNYLILLNPQAYAEIVRLMPFVVVPPCVDNNGRFVAIPIEGSVPREGTYYNPAPFLYHVNTQGGQLNLQLTVPSEFIIDLVNAGGIVQLYHGAARYIAGTWARTANLKSEDYLPSRERIGRLDIDLLAIMNKQGISASTVALNTTQRINRANKLKGNKRWASTAILSRSMASRSKIPYAVIWQGEHSYGEDIYQIAHDSITMIQVVPEWGGANSQIEMALAFSSFRGMGFTPVVLSAKSNQEEVVGLKMIDWFFGLSKYAEATEALMVAGKKRTAISFPDYDSAMPLGQPIGPFMATRTMADLIYAEAILLPSRLAAIIPEKGKDYWLEAIQGSKEFSHRLARIADSIPQIVARVDDQTLDDLRKELAKVKKMFNDKPARVLTLLSPVTETFTDKSEGIIGAEFARLWPNFYKFTQANGRLIWARIYKKAMEYYQVLGSEYFEELKPIDLLMQIIRDDDEARGELGHIVQEAFLADPASVGPQYLKTKINPISAIRQRGRWTKSIEFDYDLMSLDINGLGPLAVNYDRWIKFVNAVVTGAIQIIGQTRDEKIENLKRSYFAMDPPMDEAKEHWYQRWQRNMKKQDLPERQQMAIKDFLLDPGF